MQKLKVRSLVALMRRYFVKVAVAELVRVLRLRANISMHLGSIAGISGISLVFYDDKEGVRAGKAVEVNNDKITLQQFIPNEANRVWLPDWRLEDNETKQTGEQPKGARPELVKIRPTKVIATGQLKKSGHLTAPLIKTLTALGVI